MSNHIGCHTMKAEGIRDLRELRKLDGFSWYAALLQKEARSPTA